MYETSDTKSIRKVVNDKTYVNDASSLQSRVEIQKWASEGKGFGKFLNTMTKQKVLTRKEALMFALHHGYGVIDGKRVPPAKFVEIPMLLEEMREYKDISNPEVAMIIYNCALNKLAVAYPNYLVKIKTPTQADIANIFNMPKKDDDERIK